MTAAWAEGAIDGRPEDYEMASSTATEFRFSRFSEDANGRADRATDRTTDVIMRSQRIPSGSATAAQAV